MLHKLRRGMVIPKRGLTRGVAKVDKTCSWIVGRKAQSRRNGQLFVVGAVEDRGEVSGRVFPQSIPSFIWATVAAFVEANIAHGTTIKTDGLKSYEAPDREHYR